MFSAVARTTNKRPIREQEARTCVEHYPLRGANKKPIKTNDNAGWPSSTSSLQCLMMSRIRIIGMPMLLGGGRPDSMMCWLPPDDQMSPVDWSAGSKMRCMCVYRNQIKSHLNGSVKWCLLKSAWLWSVAYFGPRSISIPGRIDHFAL